MREARMAASPGSPDSDRCCLCATNRDLRKSITEFSGFRYYFFLFPFSNRAIEYKQCWEDGAGGHAMFKITINASRTAIACLAGACFASPAHAELTGAGGMPVVVSDALLATTRAANLHGGLVGNVGGAPSVGIAPVNATPTSANNVRLWDEVIPPAPSPKPTQASLTVPGQPRTLAVSALSAQVGAAAGMQSTSLRVNTNSGRMPPGFPR